MYLRKRSCIPDKDTADALIAEKIGEGRWENIWALRQPVR
jgi:hypothetical protein